MTSKITLLVDDTPIRLNHFVREFIDHAVGGMIASLEGTGEIEKLDISIEGGNVSINLNNTLVPANPFVCKIIRSTIAGMVSSLEGVGEINAVKLSIKR